MRSAPIVPPPGAVHPAPCPALCGLRRGLAPWLAAHFSFSSCSPPPSFCSSSDSWDSLCPRRAFLPRSSSPLPGWRRVVRGSHPRARARNHLLHRRQSAEGGVHLGLASEALALELRGRGRRRGDGRR